MIPQTEEEIEYVTRDSLRHHPTVRKSPDDDCGCNKNYPFADILPKDESYIDFTKNKEIVGMVVNDIGMKCSNIMTFVHTLKNYYPTELLDSNLVGLRDSVSTLETALTALKEHLISREELARDVLKSNGTWIKRSN